MTEKSESSKSETIDKAVAFALPYVFPSESKLTPASPNRARSASPTAR